MATLGYNNSNMHMITIYNVSFSPPKSISFYGAIPQEWSENHSTQFETVQIKSRSNPLASYAGSSARTVSLSIDVHEDYIDEFETAGACTTDLSEYIGRIRSITYPRYQDTFVLPPRVYIVIGDIFRMKGYCTNCSVNWKPPIRNKHFIYATISMEISETLSISFTADEVYEHADLARYGHYHEGSAENGGSFTIEGADSVPELILSPEQVTQQESGGSPLSGDFGAPVSISKGKFDMSAIAGGLFHS